MKVRELLADAKQEVQTQLETRAKVVLRGHLQEIAAAERNVAVMKEQLEEFLERPIEDGLFDG